MSGKVRRARVLLYILVLGTVGQLSTCQVLPDQTGTTAASLQGLVDAVQSFIGDFARQVLAAAVL